MSTISSIMGQNLTRNGQTQIFANAVSQSGQASTQTQMLMASAAEVVQNITQNIAEVEANAREMQRMSNIAGRTLQFNVNKELGNVVIKIIDPKTDKVVREIPSAEMQQLHIRLRKTIGLIADLEA